MAKTPVVGSGPVEFMDESGQQLLIPLSDLSFDANGNPVASDWPLYAKHKDAVDALLEYLVGTGALTPAPQPAPTAALVVTAKNKGAGGNNIQLTVSNSGTTDANDHTKFDSSITETDRWTGVTKDTVEQTVGTTQNGSALIFITKNSAKGRPKNGDYQMPNAAPFKVSVLQADNATEAFEAQARNPADAEAQHTTVTVSGVSNDPNDPSFTLTAVWVKGAAKVHAADLAGQFGYEISVDPPAGGALGVPANGTTALRGGAEAQPASAASAIVVAGG
jgi:hypothetical protein